MKVYVAGQYSADNVIDVLKNIGKGRKACAELFQLGFSPFCPWHDAAFIIDNPDAYFTVEQFYLYSIEWLKVSDAMLLLPGWKLSKGTLSEIKIAEELEIPIFTDLQSLMNWAIDKNNFQNADSLFCGSEQSRGVSLEVAEAETMLIPVFVTNK